MWQGPVCVGDRHSLKLNLENQKQDVLCGEVGQMHSGAGIAWICFEGFPEALETYAFGHM